LKEQPPITSKKTRNGSVPQRHLLRTDNIVLPPRCDQRAGGYQRNNKFATT
jgi:hypothetical protein